MMNSRNTAESIGKAIDFLRVVVPELGLDIVELGMAKGAVIDDDGVVTVTIALTTSGCPLRAQIQKDIRPRVGRLPAVTKVSITWTELTQDEKAAAMAKARFNLSQDGQDGIIICVEEFILRLSDAQDLLVPGLDEENYRYNRQLRIPDRPYARSPRGFVLFETSDLECLGPRDRDRRICEGVRPGNPKGRFFLRADAEIDWRGNAFRARVQIRKFPGFLKMRKRVVCCVPENISQLAGGRKELVLFELAMSSDNGFQSLVNRGVGDQ